MGYMREHFDARKAVIEIKKWIKYYFAESGPDTKAVIGISGGKDSTIAATLLVEALGADRVIGVMMPCGGQSDIYDSIEVCEMLNIKHFTVEIGQTMEMLTKALPDEIFSCDNNIYYTNTPARLRMATLYGIAGLVHGRVANTCNFSEDYVGYSTKWGDNAGDFAVLANYTVSEVIAIGEYLELPAHFVHKAPSDGMCGKTDEDNLGIKYATLDSYIMDDMVPDVDALRRIKTLYDRSRHKAKHMPTAPNPFYYKRKNNRMADRVCVEEGDICF